MAQQNERINVPTWDGSMGQKYREYKTAARRYLASVSNWDQELVAPRLIARLTGEAKRFLEPHDSEKFRCRTGLDSFLALLDSRFSTLSEK